MSKTSLGFFFFKFFFLMPLHVTSNYYKEKTLRIFIPLDIEGPYKTNYSKQADFLEEFSVSDLVPDEHHPCHLSLMASRPSLSPTYHRYDTTHSMYWKRSPACDTLLSTYLGADAMAKGRWSKTWRLKRTVKTLRAWWK